jgi:gamma-butyrobetaine dioxygenase
MVRVAKLSDKRRQLTLQFDNGSFGEFASVWLREACRCDQCRDPEGMFRLDALNDLDADLALFTAEITDQSKTLRMVWPDGHVSELSTKWLLRQSAPDSSFPNPSSQRLWYSNFQPAAASIDELADDAAHLDWLSHLWSDGVAVVTGVPTTRDALNTFASRIGHIRASNYGVEWEIVASADPQDPVHSTAGLRVHTDLPYRQVPPGVQLNLCAVADATGGESTMVDGFAVAKELEDRYPRAFAALTQVPVPNGYRTDDHDLRWSAPPLTLDHDGNPLLLRFAPDLVGQVRADPTTTREAHRAYGLFGELTADARFEVSFRLKPGELLAMHNHRVLHGRKPFDLSSGGRQLLGCYLDVDDLHSTMRVLRHRISSAGAR